MLVAVEEELLGRVFGHLEVFLDDNRLGYFRFALELSLCLLKHEFVLIKSDDIRVFLFMT